MQFRAELESSGKNTAGFEVPESIVEQLGGGKHPKIVATVNGFTFRTSIASMGGRFMFGLSADRRQEAGVQAGEVHDVEVELDTAPREVEVPEDLELRVRRQRPDEPGLVEHRQGTAALRRHGCAAPPATE